MIHEKFYMVLFKGHHPRLQYAHKIMVHVIENEVECTLKKILQKGLINLDLDYENAVPKRASLMKSRTKRLQVLPNHFPKFQGGEHS